ncbi:hypothetical protein H6G33_05675 [Calothrix sp. FACHB-1219]|uniref:hypothetical protein n=1 Tax=unclassified Calothrix TaxID=2619626 RepID=UPI0016877323|nr:MULTISPECIES: hypothetical protein [unclassified Calothrix]MBD2205109.1 hypothetical protein [Calothrix sp. FACHB-168]MBD2216515.1 hypothetical protein [Calothrix sp. FACHB-1219]
MPKSNVTPSSFLGKLTLNKKLIYSQTFMVMLLFSRDARRIHSDAESTVLSFGAQIIAEVDRVVDDINTKFCLSDRSEILNLQNSGLWVQPICCQ